MSVSITNQQNLLSQAAGVDLGSNPTSAGKKASQLGQADFLRLLTVQLQNQDPMSPMSDMDFIASMSSFSSVDAISSLSSNFQTFTKNQGSLNQSMLETLQTLSENLSDSKNLQTRLSAQSYLGKEVTLDDPVRGTFSGIVERVELIEKLDLDGTNRQMIGAVINDEIFPVDWITAIAEPRSLISGMTGAFSSAMGIASNLLERG
jgi:flagellar hook assembly protein FlgD